MAGLVLDVLPYTSQGVVSRVSRTHRGSEEVHDIMKPPLAQPASASYPLSANSDAESANVMLEMVDHESEPLTVLVTSTPSTKMVLIPLSKSIWHVGAAASGSSVESRAWRILEAVGLLAQKTAGPG